VDNKFRCKVCGYNYGDYVWGEDGKTPSFEICPCCGTTFGHEDVTIEGIQKKRRDWISGGGKWFVEKERPSNWTMEKQLNEAGIEI